MYEHAQELISAINETVPPTGPEEEVNGEPEAIPSSDEDDAMEE